MKKVVKKRMLILCLLVLMEFVNVATFVLLGRQDDRCDAELICLKEDPQSDVVNYLIAGLLNQADVAFYGFIDEMEGSVVCVNFKRNGWNPEAMADKICRDRAERHCQIVRVWSVSVGDQAARFVDWMAIPVETIAINPCTKELCLKDQLRNLGWAAKALRGLCEYGLGWLSLMPIISMSVGETDAPGRSWRYSPMLVADQLVAIMEGSHILGQHESEYVILSRHDQFLDNARVKTVFERCGAEFIEVDADHADMVRCAEEYRQAFRQTGWLRDDVVS